MKFPYADTPAIIRSHQKDSYYLAKLIFKFEETIKTIFGTKFLSNKQNYIQSLAKLVYFLTLYYGISPKTFGNTPKSILSNKNHHNSYRRTLGEEYADIKKSHKGNLIQSNSIRNLIYVILTVFHDHLTKGFIKKWSILNKLIKILSVLMEINLGFFYLHGDYYSIFTRFLGLRYVFGYGGSQEKNSGQQINKTYKIFGFFILIKTGLGILTDPEFGMINHILILMDKIQKKSNKKLGNDNNIKNEKEIRIPIQNIASLISKNNNNNSNDFSSINLADEKVLPFISNRDCPLCLDPMLDPTSIRCGHLYCWKCIVDWYGKNNLNCPLCRALMGKDFILIR